MGKEDVFATVVGLRVGYKDDEIIWSFAEMPPTEVQGVLDFLKTYTNICTQKKCWRCGTRCTR